MMLATFASRRNLVIVISVLLIHVAGLWALQSGLLARVVEVVAPVQWVEVLTPQQPVPPPPPEPKPVKPTAKPAQTPPPQSRPEPQVTPATAPVDAPVLAAVANAPPSPSAPVGVAAPAVVAQPAAAAVTAAPRVELPSSDAEYLHNPKPEYPRQSRQRNEQGKVIVNVFIGVDGLPQKAEVKVSSGFERLDAAALATVRSWRYVPGKRGNVPEAMWFAVPINFVME
jgi:protein TonB